MLRLRPTVRGLKQWLMMTEWDWSITFLPTSLPQGDFMTWPDMVESILAGSILGRKVRHRLSVSRYMASIDTNVGHMVTYLTAEQQINQCTPVVVSIAAPAAASITLVCCPTSLNAYPMVFRYMVHIRLSAAARLRPSYLQWRRTASGVQWYLCPGRASLLTVSTYSASSSSHSRLAWRLTSDDTSECVSHMQAPEAVRLPHSIVCRESHSRVRHTSHH